MNPQRRANRCGHAALLSQSLENPCGVYTWPTPGCYDDGVVLPRLNPDPQTGRRQVFIMTTIQTQRPTLVYVACFYPDLTAFAGLLLSRHSHMSSVQALSRVPTPASSQSLTNPAPK